jgi:hypothetical protein
MAILVCHLKGIGDPLGIDRNRLLNWIEIDRCVADAISAVTGLGFGKRSKHPYAFESLLLQSASDNDASI